MSLHDYTRRDFLKMAGLGAVIMRSGHCSTIAKGVEVSHKPHIVMFLSDDHGLEFSGCYGNNIIQTPHLDALAKEGMRFTKMFAASPTCVPSRSSLYTGLYPSRNGAIGNHTSCKAGVKSLPTYSKALGYRVVLANKVHVKPKDVFDFEYVKLSLPGDPNQPRRYRDEGLDTAAVDGFLAGHVKEHPGQPLCLILADSSPHVTWETNKIYDVAKLAIMPYMVDTPKTRAGLANYYQDISTMDKRIGDVLGSLKKHGYEENTLLIYTSDQGPEWPHCKWTLYDTGLRVPFIVRWPGKVKAGSVCDAMMSLVDVTPTFIEAAGGMEIEGLDGRSFKDVLLGRTGTFREEIFATHTGDREMNVFPQRCVRDKRYKYVLNLRPERTWTTHFTKVAGIPNSHKDIWDSWVEKAKTDARTAKLLDIMEHHTAEELYDTEADPYELNNIAKEAGLKPILDKLRKDLKEWMASQGDTGVEGQPGTKSG